MPQAPQFAALELTLTQAPEQLIWGRTQLVTQAPLEQTWLGPQALAQAPQLAGSELVLTHAAPHFVSPVAQLQAPAVHAPEHLVPQLPQFEASVLGLTHAPEQEMNPLLQPTAHTPALQVGSAFCPAGQIVPQAPQLITSFVVSVQSPPHADSFAAHELLQLLPEQTWPLRHAPPHVPQWFGSDARSTHWPAQLVLPAGQPTTHVPAEQASARPQDLSQAPQCLGLLWVSTQAPQLVSPCPHVDAHLPPLHRAKPPLGTGQGVAQAPQFSTSLSVLASQPSVESPLQSSCVELHALAPPAPAPPAPPFRSSKPDDSEHAATAAASNNARARPLTRDRRGRPVIAQR